jgi:amino acid adenylation domain-containing protein/thioester reductase-like protein
MLEERTFYPLTKAQESVQIIESFYPGTSFVNVCGTVRIKEEVDFTLFNRAINHMLEQNEALRTRIHRQNGSQVQYIEEYRFEEFPLFDFSKGDGRSEYYRWERQISQQPFEFYDSKLYYFALVKIGPNESAFYIKGHHIILDAWSIILLANEVLEDYCKLKKGLPPQKRQRTSFVQTILNEQDYLASARFQKDRAFWQEIIAKCQEPALFDTKNVKSTKAKCKSLPLPPAISTLISNYCLENRISPFIAFASILAIYLAKTKDKNIIIIGTPFLNRSGKEKNTIGMFVNNFPIVIEVEPSQKYRDFAEKLTSEWLKLLRHGKYPYVQLLKDYREMHQVKGRLYDLTLSFQNAKFDKQEIDFTTEWHFNEQEVNPLSININDRENKGIYHIDYHFWEEALSDFEIEQINQGLIQLLEEALQNPDLEIARLNLLSPTQRQLVLEEFNRTDYAYPAEKSLVQLFEEQADANPEKTAVIFAGDKMAYREVDLRANQLANFLLKQGVKKQDIVVLKVERSFNMIIGILGILKAGAAYLPVDPTYPQQRLVYMLEDSKAKILLTNGNGGQGLLNNGQSSDLKVFNLDSPEIWAESTERPRLRIEPTNLAYVIYTSGSTGLPKGVMLEHRAVNNFVHGVTEAVGLRSYNNILALTTISFDIFFLETILPLLCGMQTVIADEVETNDVALILELIQRYKIEVLQATPSRMKAILNDAYDNAMLADLKLLLIGGEAFPESLLSSLRKVTPAEIYNMYGPTETTIWSTVKRLTQTDLITIGKPIANTQVYILDRCGMPLPLGTAGEIYLAGDGVARGYINKEELTAKRFLPNPFCPGTVMYRTGDMGLWLADGEIKYLGRNDNQVKIRGYRIETEEIEKCLLRLEQVKEAVVVGRSGKSDRTYLYAYLTGSKLSVLQLRSHLMKYLPDYMVPTRFIWLDSIPYTPNGKIDRKALAALDVYEEEQSVDYVAPRDAIEKAMAAAWAEALEREQIGIDDDFFVLGGDSLAILEVLAGVLNQGWKLTAQDFYEYPTIRRLAGIIRQRNNSLGSDAVSPGSGDREELSSAAVEALFKEETAVYSWNPEKATATSAAIHDIQCQLPNQNKGVLLTGSTGFLGIHILRELLHNYPGRIYCLIRGNNPEARLTQLYNYYFRQEPDLRRVKILSGQIEDSRLGLTAEEYAGLGEAISEVIHSAALVKHYGLYTDFEKTNVLGTENIINFCLPHNIHLYFVSTISVSGNFLPQSSSKTFSEKDLFIGQDYKSNVYVRSKYEAECQVFEAQSKGLQASILRVGILTGRYTDGFFQHNIEENAFYRKLKSVLQIKCLPVSNLDEYIELTPVDCCAQAIRKIATQPASGQSVYHLFNHKLIKIRDFFEPLKSRGIEVKGISVDDFLLLINRLAQTDEGKETISGIITDLAFFGSLSFSSSVQVDSALTISTLEQLDFTWPDLTAEYCLKVIDYMQEIGYLENIKSTCRL